MYNLLKYGWLLFIYKYTYAIKILIWYYPDVTNYVSYCVNDKFCTKAISNIARHNRIGFRDKTGRLWKGILTSKGFNQLVGHEWQKMHSLVNNILNDWRVLYYFPFCLQNLQLVAIWFFCLKYIIYKTELTEACLGHRWQIHLHKTRKIT